MCSLYPPSHWASGFHDPHFTEAKTEAQRGAANGSKPCGRGMSELEPRSVTLLSGALGPGKHLIFSFPGGHSVKSFSPDV